MPLENHSLVQDFPEYKAQIHDLKMKDNHFAKVFEEYDAVTHQVHHFESGAEACSDEHLESLKKQRLHLKDALFAMLQKAA
jgi:uncharacterized protein YdcH (DUF465 family)